MKVSREQVLIIDYLDLPNFIRDELHKLESFRNDVMLPHISELSFLYEDDIKAGEDLSRRITTYHIENYYKDQCETNNYKGSLAEFISDYGLTIDAWLISANIDLTGIHRVIFNVCC